VNEQRVTGMVGPHGLEHGPETVAQVQGQNQKGEYIERGVEKRAEEGSDSLSDSSMIAKGDSRGVDQGKEEDKESAVDHGHGGPGGFYGPCLDPVALWPGLAVLEKKQGAGRRVYSKDEKQACAEDRDDQGMTVQLVRIGLEEGDTGKKCGIACRMTAEKEEQAETSAGHDRFFTDRGLEKVYKPHTLEPKVKGTSCLSIIGFQPHSDDIRRSPCLWVIKVDLYVNLPFFS